MRRLSPEERALWSKVVASVRPLHPGSLPEAAPPLPAEPAKVAPQAVRRPPPRPVTTPRRPAPGETLDGTWDRRLARGIVQPDLTVDLHGHNLATAYHLLDQRLEAAIGMGARIMLLVTGKPPVGEPPVARGRIRAAVGDWLAASRHSADIAAVRGAHPRHGGTGALYIIFRRRK